MRWRVAVLALAVVLAGCSAVAGPSAESTETLTPAPVPDPATERQESAIAPGLGGGEVRDVDRLARAHRAAVRNRSYTWTERLTSTWIDGNRSLGVRSQLRVETEYRYRYEATSKWSPVNATEYADGEYRYNRQIAAGGFRYRRTPATNVTGRFGERTTAAIRRYLAVENATVAVVRVNGSRHYRVTGRADTIPTIGSVRNYSVRAVVAPDGFVRSLEATYVATERGGPERVSYRYAYTDVGATTVSPPPWTDREWPDEGA